MKKTIKWLLVLVPVVLLALIAIRAAVFHFSLFGMEGMSFRGGQQFMQPGMGGGRGFGHHGGRPHGFYPGQSPFFFDPMMLLLLKAGLVLAGWLIWKKAKASPGKWAGAILFSLAVFALLPKILGVPFILIMAYAGYKSVQKNNVSDMAFVPAAEFGPAMQHKSTDILDEWERTLRHKEE